MGGLAQLRFYAELNDFLPPALRGKAIAYPLAGSPSVKDAIESMGVPHTEVDLVLVNGESSDFSARVTDRTRVSAFPVFESLDIAPLLRVRPTPLRQLRFLLDGHLAGLSKLLRMLGFDAALPQEQGDAALAHSASSGWYLLTRDRALLMRRSVTHGYFVRAEDSLEQAREVMRRFDLRSSIRPFTRCLRCNAPLSSISPAALVGRIPESIRRRYVEFRTCPICLRVYWAGSHQQRMECIVRAASS